MFAFLVTFKFCLALWTIQLDNDIRNKIQPI